MYKCRYHLAQVYLVVEALALAVYWSIIVCSLQYFLSFCSMVAIGKKEEMAKVDTKKPTISDANTDSGTDSDSDGSDPPELEDNAGSALPGAHGDDKEGVSNTDILTHQ